MKKNKVAYTTIDLSDETKRLNRVIGQIEGIRSMLKDQRRLDDVLMQCKAVHSALKSVETRIVKAHLEATLDEVAKIDKKKNRAEKLAELEDLFKQAS
jgi:CsoR family transcriptional regulator, copper-sensing transcriptional repressor